MAKNPYDAFLGGIDRGMGILDQIQRNRLNTRQTDLLERRLGLESAQDQRASEQLGWERKQAEAEAGRAVEEAQLKTAVNEVDAMRQTLWEIAQPDPETGKVPPVATVNQQMSTVFGKDWRQKYDVLRQRVFEATGVDVEKTQPGRATEAVSQAAEQAAQTQETPAPSAPPGTVRPSTADPNKPWTEQTPWELIKAGVGGVADYTGGGVEDVTGAFTNPIGETGQKIWGGLKERFTTPEGIIGTLVPGTEPFMQMAGGVREALTPNMPAGAMLAGGAGAFGGAVPGARMKLAQGKKIGEGRRLKRDRYKLGAMSPSNPRSRLSAGIFGRLER